MNGDPINIPSESAAARGAQAAEQLGGAISDALLTGMAQAVAKLMTDRTLEPGPWLLTGDGRLYAVTPESPSLTWMEMLRRHIIDWGCCDHPANCECSDAVARRALGLLDPSDQDVPEQHNHADPFLAPFLAQFIAMRDLLKEFANDSGLNQTDLNDCRLHVDKADRLLHGE